MRQKTERKLAGFNEGWPPQNINAAQIYYFRMTEKMAGHKTFNIHHKGSKLPKHIISEPKNK